MSAHEAMPEDDYSEESNADSVCDDLSWLERVANEEVAAQWFDANTRA